MCTNDVFDASFAAELISSLKRMIKPDGGKFITNGVTLPFLAYAYKCLNNDSSPITKDYLWNIISSLENADGVMFLYQNCSTIEESVISLRTQEDSRIEEEGYYTRTPESNIFYDLETYKNAPSANQLYEKYEEVLSNKTYSRVYKEYYYDWAAISEEESNAINTIVKKFRQK